MGFTMDKNKVLDRDFCNSIRVVDSLIGFLCDADIRLTYEMEFWEQDSTLCLSVPDSKNKRWATFLMREGEVEVRVGHDYLEGEPRKQIIKGSILEFLWTLPDPK